LTPDLLWTTATLLAAPCVGSFVGLLTLRLPAGRPWIVARSACDGCRRELGVLDLAPIVGFALLQGRCRTCRAPIPRRYPLIEIGCLLIAVWSVAAQSGPEIPATAVFGWGLLAIAIVDAENLWLPDVLTLPLGLAGWLATVALGLAAPLEPLIGAAVGYGFLTAVAWIYKTVRGREGLGGGDPFLLGAIGAWVGWAGLPSVLLWACGAGLAVAVLQPLLGRRASMTQALPFGTFLAIGAWLTWLIDPISTPLLDRTS